LPLSRGVRELSASTPAAVPLGSGSTATDTEQVAKSRFRCTEFAPRQDRR
jgi:hypothetical protein